MRVHRGVLCSVACALALALPQRARACSIGISVAEVWPPGGPLPANAFAMVTGSILTGRPELFTILVDGAPVELIDSDRLSGGGGLPLSSDAQIAVRPLVPLPVGATWSLQFESDDGPQLLGTFTVTPADETPPTSPPAALHFDVHDYPGSECSSCGEYAINYWAQFPEAPDDGGAPIVQALYLGHPGADDDRLVGVRRIGPFVPSVQNLTMDWFADGQPVTEGVCFTLRKFDLAGHEAASALRTCEPCHAIVDPMQTECEGVYVGDEPNWTDADLFPGGACEAEVAAPLPPEAPAEPEPTTGAPTSDDPGDASSDESGESPGGDPDKAGCGCRSDASSPFALALLALAGLRRRARPTASNGRRRVRIPADA